MRRNRPAACGRIACAILGVFLAMLGTGSGASGAAKEPADPAGRLKTVQQRLAQSRQEEDALSRHAQELAAESTRLQDAAIDAARTLQTSEAEASLAEAQLARLAQSERSRASDLIARQDRERQVLMALQRLSALPPEAVIAGPQDPLDAARAGMLLGSLIPRIESEARAIAQDLATLRQTRIELDAKRDAYQARLALLIRDRQQLANLIRQKQQLAGEARDKAQASQKKVAQLSAEAGDLKELIDRLERQRKAEEERVQKAEEDRVRHDAEEEQRRREAARQRPVVRSPDQPSPPLPSQAPAQAPPQAQVPPQAQAPPQAVAQTAAQVAALSPPASIHRPLRAFQPGKSPLLRPVAGEITRKFGEMDGFIRSEGITWRTRPSAVVVAPFDGKIDYAVMKGYGQILIIVHGGGYYSVLAGIDQIDVAVGQEVLAGEPLGSMSGTVGAGDKAQSLYFEMRKSDKTINPLPWLMARDERVSG